MERDNVTSSVSASEVVRMSKESFRPADRNAIVLDYNQSEVCL